MTGDGRLNKSRHPTMMEATYTPRAKEPNIKAHTTVTTETMFHPN